jgi:GT2 family glycosyltransferase
VTRFLLAITTANYYSYTKVCLNSLRRGPPDWDVVVVDDASEDPTADVVTSLGVEFITKDQPRGLTDSWNRAAELFRVRGHDWLVLSNNDVIFPEGALRSFQETAEAQGPCILGPMSTTLGVGHVKAQSITKQFGRQIMSGLDPFGDCDVIQRRVADADPAVDVLGAHKVVNGFFFAVPRPALDLVGRETLFDPSKTNVGNEDEFCAKVGLPKVICRRTYIPHFKGVSFNGHPKGGTRNRIWNEV